MPVSPSLRHMVIIAGAIAFLAPAMNPATATMLQAKPDRPSWLADAHAMRWVGGVYAPDSALSASYRPYRLTDAFDAVIYVPVVQAEPDPGDQPIIPARKR